MNTILPDFKIVGNPDYAMLELVVPKQSSLMVESGSMVYMSPGLKLSTKLTGGVQRLLAGEKLFINQFSAGDSDEEIGIAPALPGDIRHYQMDNQTIYLQSSAYLASTPGITLEARFQGMQKGFFSGQGLFLAKCSGSGLLWFNTYGALIEIEVDGNHVVDTGHIAGFTEGLDYTVQPVGGLRSTIFSGEGLVCRFSGRGKVWVQSRLAPAFVHWAQQFRPVKSKTNSSNSSIKISRS